MSDTLRLFIGVELSAPVRAALGELQEQLRPARHPLRWVAPESLHLTLQFLGEADPALLPAITAAMGEALAGHGPLRLQLGAPGVFPNPRRPNVVWVGVGGAVAELSQLQERLSAALEPLGFAREVRPFRPHLTIGRVHRDATPDQQARIGAAVQALPAPPALEWQVERVVLFESELRPGGPRYTARATGALAGAGG